MICYHLGAQAPDPYLMFILFLEAPFEIPGYTGTPDYYNTID